MTYAIDAETCELRWRHVVHDIVKVGNFRSSNNRGVAYLDGKLFRGTADGRLISLDAKIGKKLWQVTSGDQAKAECP